MGIVSESLLSFHDAARMLPPNRVGKSVNFSTVWRWALKGVRTIDGHRVKLEAARVGGRWLTSKQALERFAAALTPPACTDTSAALRTPSQRERACDLAAKRLEEIGI